MPPIKRLSPGRRNWNELHRDQLKTGADHSGQRFGQSNIRSRRRYQQSGPNLTDDERERAWNMAGTDFSADTMALAAAAWGDLKNELLAEAVDPNSLWGYRRFETPATDKN